MYRVHFNPTGESDYFSQQLTAWKWKDLLLTTPVICSCKVFLVLSQAHFWSYLYVLLYYYFFHYSDSKYVIYNLTWWQKKALLRNFYLFCQKLILQFICYLHSKARYGFFCRFSLLKPIIIDFTLKIQFVKK